MTLSVVWSKKSLDIKQAQWYRKSAEHSGAKPAPAETRRSCSAAGIWVENQVFMKQEFLGRTLMLHRSRGMDFNRITWRVGVITSNGGLNQCKERQVMSFLFIFLFFK